MATELGGIAIAPHPKLSPKELKPGYIMKPSFGVIPCLIDKKVVISLMLTPDSFIYGCQHLHIY